jgi:hypothetical protein
MYLDAELHMAYRVGNVPFNMFPYPHFYLQDVFPADFYQQIQRNIPDSQAMIPLEQARGTKGYDERFVLNISKKGTTALSSEKSEFWNAMHHWLVVKGNFGTLIFEKFKPFIQQRFANRTNVEFYSEALLVQDITNYKLGPHTDADRKVVTMLFYLPADDSQKHMGTSLYLPNDPEFTCPGGPHYNRNKFQRLHTNPFLPNSMFAFFKTDNSFHGVEPVGDPGTKRWLLLYDIFYRETAPAPEPAKVTFNTNVTVKPKVNFSF